MCTVGPVNYGPPYYKSVVYCIPISSKLGEVVSTAANSNDR